eukprot:scaffold17149_cov120-Isochrysis_galbana.AAC.1
MDGVVVRGICVCVLSPVRPSSVRPSVTTSQHHNHSLYHSTLCRSLSPARTQNHARHRQDRGPQGPPPQSARRCWLARWRPPTYTYTLRRHPAVDLGSWDPAALPPAACLTPPPGPPGRPRVPGRWRCGATTPTRQKYDVSEPFAITEC